jgi:hypothetical protein
VRQRRDGADHRQLAHVARAVVAFETPDRDDHLLRRAELLLDAGEQRGVALQELAAAADAALRHARGSVFLEGLAEGAALAAVEGQHVRVDRDAGEGLADHRAGDALRLRLARNLRQERLEVAAALGGERWS